jgi:hypothetical protein
MAPRKRGKAVPAFFEPAPGHQQSAIDKAGVFSCPVGRKRFRPPMSAKPTMLYTLTDEAPALVRSRNPALSASRKKTHQEMKIAIDTPLRISNSSAYSFFYEPPSSKTPFKKLP